MKLRPELFTVNLASWEHPECIWTQRQTVSLLDEKIEKMCPELFFINLVRQRTSKMRLNFTTNRFVYGRTTHEIAPRTFSVKLAGRELPKCVWTSRQISSFLDAKSRKSAQNFFNLQSENLQIAPGLHGKQLHFRTQKSWKCAQNIFVNFGGGYLKKCIWTSWQTALLWNAKIGKCAQNFFINFATGEYPKYVWTFYMLWPENGFNRENMSLTSLKKYLNWVLWNLSQWRKLRPKMQVPIFKIFVGWRPKKMPKVPFFFPLRGNTAANTYWMDFFLETCSFLNNCFYVF